MGVFAVIEVGAGTNWGSGAEVWSRSWRTHLSQQLLRGFSFGHGGESRVLDAKERALYRQPTGPNSPYHLDDLSTPALRHGSLNCLFM